MKNVSQIRQAWDQYVAEYEWRGDEGDYTPNEQELMLMNDCFYGFLEEVLCKQDDNAMIHKAEWNEFRDSGLLWFVNSILHVFGWALCIDFDNVEKKEVREGYPARCKFRGFTETANTLGYIRITEFLKKNVEQLLKEAKE